MDPVRQESLCLLQFRATCGRESFSCTIDEIGQHAQAGSRSFRRNFLRCERSRNRRSAPCEESFGRMSRIRFHTCNPSLPLSGHVALPLRNVLQTNPVPTLQPAPACPVLQTSESPPARLRAGSHNAKPPSHAGSAGSPDDRCRPQSAGSALVRVPMRNRQDPDDLPERPPLESNQPAPQPQREPRRRLYWLRSTQEVTCWSPIPVVANRLPREGGR